MSETPVFVVFLYYVKGVGKYDKWRTIGGE